MPSTPSTLPKIGRIASCLSNLIEMCSICVRSILGQSTAGTCSLSDLAQEGKSFLLSCCRLCHVVNERHSISSGA
jgi:hypothetical protein